MQPDGPYRFTEPLGGCQVGRAWAALDGQDRPVTVVMLEGVAAEDPAWREAFANAATVLAHAPDGHRYLDADFTAASPWVAYGVEEEGAPARLFRTLGMDYLPTENAEMPPPPPVTAPPRPVSTPPQPPWSPQPWAIAPQPVSGMPVSPVAAVTVAMPVIPDPRDPSATRRIAPVSPPPRRRNWIWAALALVLVLVAGTVGFFIGAGGKGEGTGSSPSASPSLPLYEATQFSLNKAKFEGELAPLAEPWLTHVLGCAGNDEVGGPKLPADEKRHVFCRYGGASLHFALYAEPAKRDAARAYRQQLNIAGGALAPGLREATRTKGGVTGAPGTYLEYAFKGEDGRTICGVWWDRDDVQGAFYVETLCEAGINGNWDALRDLWRRNS